MSPVRQFDTVSAIVDFESGTMPPEDVVPFFQWLVDTGLAWTLQGSYGRTAAALIESGEVVARRATRAPLLGPLSPSQS